MAIETKCSTPGAIFETHIRPDSIEIVILMPNDIDLNEVDAIHLEKTIHNAIELALAPIFVSGAT